MSQSSPLSPVFSRSQVRQTLIGYFFAGAFSFVYVLFVPLLIRFGFSEGTSTFVFAIAALLAALVGPMMGDRLDQNRTAAVMVPASVFFVIGVLPFVWDVPRWASLTFPIFFFIAHSILAVSTRKIVEGSVDPKDRGRNSLLWYFAHNAAFAVASILAYLFISRYSVQLVVLDLATSLAFLALMAVVLKSRVSRPEKKVVDASLMAGIRPFLLGFRFSFEHPRLSLVVILVGLAGICHVSALPVIFSMAGLDVTRNTSLVYLVNTVVVCCVSLFFSYFPLKKVTQRSTFLFAALLTGLGHILFPFFLSTGGIVATTVLWSVGEALVVPVFTHFVFTYFDKNKGGLGAGIKSYFLSLSLFLTPLIVSVMVGWVGVSKEFIGIFFGTLPFLGILGFLFFEKNVLAFRESGRPL